MGIKIDEKNLGQVGSLQNGIFKGSINLRQIKGFTNRDHYWIL